MAKATVHFRECIQDSQDYGSDDEHMFSRVFFDIEADGQRFTNLTADIKQTLGAAFEGSALEVTRPDSYFGPLHFGAFRSAVEHYYRSLVGAKGSGIRIQGGGNIRMR